MSSDDKKPPVTKESNESDKPPDATSGTSQSTTGQHCVPSGSGSTSGQRSTDSRKTRGTHFYVSTTKSGVRPGGSASSENKPSRSGRTQVPSTRTAVPPGSGRKGKGPSTSSRGLTEIHQFKGPSFQRRQRTKHRPHRYPKLCWGLTNDGKLTPHPIGTCAQHAVKCKVQLRTNRLTDYVKRHPDLVKLLPASFIAEQCKPKTSNQQDLQEDMEGGPLELHDLMTGCCIESMVTDELTDMVSSFHFGDDQGASGSGMSSQSGSSHHDTPNRENQGDQKMFKDSTDDSDDEF